MNDKSSKGFYNKIHSENDHYGAERNYYSWAGNFHRYRIKIFKDIFKNIVRYNESTTILDVGCSKTVLGEVFYDNKHPLIEAFDISDVVIEKTKQIYPYMKFFVADAQEFSCNDKKDVVFAGEIIEHLEYPGKAFRNWANCVKDNGYMIMSTPNKVFNRKNKEHVSLLGMRDVKDLAEDNKLRIIKIIGIDVLNDIFDPTFGKILNKLNSRFLYNLYSLIIKNRLKISYNIPAIATNIIYVFQK